MHSDTIKNIFEEKAQEKGIVIPDSFHFGELIRSPGACGCVKRGWFVYQTDEHNALMITGPFSDRGIVFACAMTLHISRHFQEYRFSEEEWSVFIHGHYTSFEDIPVK